MQPLPTLRQLYFLVALARRKSFSRASEDCLVSQSTLSSAIKELENILDTELVDRTSRAFLLTAAGEVVVDRAARLLTDAEELVRAVTPADALAGPLRLGVIPTIAPFLIPPAMIKLRANYPDLALYLQEGQTHVLLDWVWSGQIDIALMAFPFEVSGLESVVFADDPFWFVCNDSHPLASRKRINLEDLNGEELLLLEEGHCLRDHALSACQLQPREAARSFGGTSLLTLAQMVQSGLGTTLFPEIAIRNGGGISDGLVQLPFKSTKALLGPVRQLGLAWRKGARCAQDAAELAQVLSRIVSATQ